MLTQRGWGFGPVLGHAPSGAGGEHVLNRALEHYAALGFAAPYFRVSTLWVSLVLLLAASAAGWALLLALAAGAGPGTQVWLPHLVCIGCLVTLEAALLAPPSYFEGRQIASLALQPYANATLAALRQIRATRSASMHDAVVNWLPSPGQHYMRHSLLGVKYLISRTALNWPGFQAAGQGPGYWIYRNDMALPLGMVQTRQITQASLSPLAALPPATAGFYRDLILINAAVVQAPVAGYGEPLDLDALARERPLSLDKRYSEPARALQQTGLQLQQFSSNRLQGSIHPTQPGLLVFSTPFSAGWELTLDGQAVPLMRANFGMLAAPVGA